MYIYTQLEHIAQNSGTVAAGGIPLEHQLAHHRRVTCAAARSLEILRSRWH
jgi:hypothetical protein